MVPEQEPADRAGRGRCKLSGSATDLRSKKTADGGAQQGPRVKRRGDPIVAVARGEVPSVRWRIGVVLDHRRPLVDRIAIVVIDVHFPASVAVVPPVASVMPMSMMPAMSTMRPAIVIIVVMHDFSSVLSVATTAMGRRHAADAKGQSPCNDGDAQPTKHG